MFRILVVCTANICRSPACEAFLKRALEGKPVVIESAGTLAVNGNGVDPAIRNLMSERGYPEVASHRSRALLPSLLKNYQLILCMENHHLDSLRSASPITVGKSMLLGHWHKGEQVDDPIGSSRETYMDSLNQMQRFCDEWARKIITLELLS